MINIADVIIETCLKRGVQDRRGLDDVAREVAGRFGSRIPGTTDLRRALINTLSRPASTAFASTSLPLHRFASTAFASHPLVRLLVRRAVRSLSGVAVVTVLTKPWPCPGQCTYCPSEARMPKSYLSDEPAAARALSLKFDPYRQVASRLDTLAKNGHPTDKVELIVKGGTWSAYATDYQDWFIRRCFEAANGFGRKTSGPKKLSLEEAQRQNESARSRIIGMTLETRPDRIAPAEIARLRRLGCTRIELGVQSLDDDILRRVRRGHDVARVAEATRLLKDAGFKVDYHLMPQLPGATPASDLKMLHQVFADPRFRPDMIKIYPCVVLKTAELYKEWKAGKYRPYPDAALVKMLARAKTAVPRYCRISRLIRDIPSTDIVAGNPVTNLRQVIAEKMRQAGLKCACLRCREIGHAAQQDPKIASAAPRFFDDEYEASGGTEHFLSFEDAKRRAVFAFCRLRLPPKPEAGSWKLEEPIRSSPGFRLPAPGSKTALLRELHTYGQHLAVGKRDPKASQHRGLGRKLMAEAERIAAAAGYQRMAVISGVGVRGYYRKLGYRLSGTYMVKRLDVRTP